MVQRKRGFGRVRPRPWPYPAVGAEGSEIEAWYRKLGARRTPRARAKAYSLLRTILNSAKNDPDVPLTENPAHIKGAGRVPRSTQIHPDPPRHTG
jgi:hypothetical protein